MCFVGLLLPNITVSFVISMGILVEFTQPPDGLPVDMYTIRLADSCPGYSNERIESTISNSITFYNLEAGMQYTIYVTAFNNATDSSNTASTTITTIETGKCHVFLILFCMVYYYTCIQNTVC